MLQLLQEKWLSVQHHIVDVHQWNGNDVFHKCDHARLTREERDDTAFLVPGSKAHTVVVNVVTKPRLLDDLKKMTKFKHTGIIYFEHYVTYLYCFLHISTDYGNPDWN